MNISVACRVVRGGRPPRCKSQLAAILFLCIAQEALSTPQTRHVFRWNYSFEPLHNNDAMARGDAQNTRQQADAEEDQEETRSLLSVSSEASDIVGNRRDSPVSQASTDGAYDQQPVKSQNKVRFQIDDQQTISANGHAQSTDARWVDEEDFLATDSPGSRRDSSGQRAPLLTDLEAPSVTVASADLDFNAEDLLESARPKSGMKSAFMNMANSIM